MKIASLTFAVISILIAFTLVRQLMNPGDRQAGFIAVFAAIAAAFVSGAFYMFVHA